MALGSRDEHVHPVGQRPQPGLAPAARQALERAQCVGLEHDDRAPPAHRPGEAANPAAVGGVRAGAAAGVAGAAPAALVAHRDELWHRARRLALEPGQVLGQPPRRRGRAGPPAVPDELRLLGDLADQRGLRRAPLALETLGVAPGHRPLVVDPPGLAEQWVRIGRRRGLGRRGAGGTGQDQGEQDGQWRCVARRHGAGSGTGEAPDLPLERAATDHAPVLVAHLRLGLRSGPIGPSPEQHAEGVPIRSIQAAGCHQASAGRGQELHLRRRSQRHDPIELGLPRRPARSWPPGPPRPTAPPDHWSASCRSRSTPRGGPPAPPPRGRRGPRAPGDPAVGWQASGRATRRRDRTARATRQLPCAHAGWRRGGACDVPVTASAPGVPDR